METNKSCCVECGEKRWIFVIKNCSWFYFLMAERTFYSIFMLLMLIGMEHKIWFFFPFFNTNRTEFSITTRTSLLFFFHSPSSEFKSVINYIDAGVCRNERFLWFDVFEVLSIFFFCMLCSAFGVIWKSSSASDSGLREKGEKCDGFWNFFLFLEFWGNNFCSKFKPQKLLSKNFCCLSSGNFFFDWNFLPTNLQRSFHKICSILPHLPLPTNNDKSTKNNKMSNKIEKTQHK